MTIKQIVPPFPIFFDDNSKALENGKIYIGTANLDPESNPITAYWDQDLVTAATQPIRTIDGYLSQSGSPGNLYVNSDYSITVRNKNDELIYTSASQDIPEDGYNFSVTGAIGGTTVKTVTLADNSAAIIEIFGAGLKGAALVSNRATFSIYRLTGTMQITKIHSEDITDGSAMGCYFELEQSGNDGIIKAYTDTGSWTVSGNIRSLSGGTLTFS